jgi:hypothetical protein
VTFQLFGGAAVTLPVKWRSERSFTVIGGTRVTAPEPGENARLKVTSVIGSIRVVGPAGTRVTLEGFSILGGRENRAAAGDGPPITVSASTFFGFVVVETQ